VLAQIPLDWLGLEIQDIPYALSTETGGAGDDLRIEFEGGVQAEVQVKGGLAGDDRLLDAVANLAMGLAADETLWGVLVVDESSSRPVREQLEVDLRRLAGGRGDGLYAVTTKILAHLDEKAIARSALSRLRLVVVGRDRPGSPYHALARTLISSVLEDASQAAGALATLTRECLQMTAERRRLDRAGFLSALRRKGFRIRTRSELETAAEAVGVPGGDRLPRVIGIEENSVEAAPEDARWLPRLEEARSLQQEGAPTSALRILDRLREEISTESVTVAFRARMHNNIGAALLDLDRAGDACDAFREALQLQPNNTTYLGNLAQAELVAERREKAAEIAEQLLRLDPVSRVGWSVRVQALGVTVESEIPSDIAEDPNILAARAMVTDARDDRVKLLRMAFECGEPDTELHVLLAESIYSSQFPRPIDEPPAPEVIHEIDRLASEAVHRTRNGEEGRLRARALVMCGVVAEFRGDLNAAAGLFREATAVAPGYERARYAAAKAELARGNPAVALYLVEDVSEGPHSGWAHALRVTALVSLRRTGEIDADVDAAMQSPEGHDRTATIHAVAEAITEAERGPRPCSPTGTSAFRRIGLGACLRRAHRSVAR
jgi:tetratricopeptide (TPR) repeat protein